jgi:hypothetical protein
MSIEEQLRSAGVLPTGPCSPWPKDREILSDVAHDTKVKASLGQMIGGLVKTTTHAVKQGRVTEEVREERYDTCKACPHFIEESKRCSSCGCFMELKTWVKAKPELLCPKNKWRR